jgi:hypothetical protein
VISIRTNRLLEVLRRNLDLCVRKVSSCRHQCCCTMAAAAVLHTLVCLTSIPCPLWGYLLALYINAFASFFFCVCRMNRAQHRSCYFSDVCFFFLLDFLFSLAKTAKGRHISAGIWTFSGLFIFFCWIFVWKAYVSGCQL